MIVDDQESYSTGLADIVGNVLKKAGVTVDRESVSQKATDFSSLVAKVGGSTKVVFLPFQLASQAQLFAQQLKSQGKTAVVVRQRRHVRLEEVQRERELRLVLRSRRDDDRRRTRRSSPRTTRRTRAARARSARRTTSPRRSTRRAATAACKDGKITRTELRQAVAKVKLASHDPRRADVVHRERRRRRREVPRLQDRERQVHDRLVARLDAGCGRACGRTPSALRAR